MADASDPRDLLYGGRAEQSVRPEPPPQPAPSDPDRRARARAFMFISRMNDQPRAQPVDYEDDGDVPFIYGLATEYGLRVKIEQFRRILLLDGANGAEIGTALWKDSLSGAGGYWALYVDAMRSET